MRYMHGAAGFASGSPLSMSPLVSYSHSIVAGGFELMS
jgi:hypothetical protein